MHVIMHPHMYVCMYECTYVRVCDEVGWQRGARSNRHLLLLLLLLHVLMLEPRQARRLSVLAAALALHAVGPPLAVHRSR